MACKSARTPRWSAARRRPSAGARSAGSAKARSAASVSWKSARRCSSATARGVRLGAGAAGRRAARGSAARSRRSRASPTRQACTSVSASRARRSWRVTAASTASWSAGGNAHSACASVGPMARVVSAVAAVGERPVASDRRCATQVGLCWSARAAPATVSPSSVRSDATTRASSSGVRVRGGALAARRRHLSSTRLPGRSTTTGTSVRPASRQHASRLKPSRTSKCPSSVGATRSGSSARSSTVGGGVPGRSAA